MEEQDGDEYITPFCFDNTFLSLIHIYMPKSFIVTKDYVYISNVSVFTLKRRFADNEIRSAI